MSGVSEESKTRLDSAGESSDVDNENCSSSGSGGETKRSCVDCGTNQTPLWRGGPAGPKSLCNACGIKSRRKKRQAALGMRPKEKKNRKSNSSSDLSSKNNTSSCSSKGVGNYLDLGFKVPVMKRTVVEKKSVWSKLDEEERAALLLMALSCGSVFA